MKPPLYLQVLAGILLGVLSLFVIVKTRNAFIERDFIGKAVKDRDLITVNGHARMTTKPDIAMVNLGVFTEGPTTAVRDDNARKMNAVIAAMQELGISKDDLQTSNYQLQPKIDWTDGRQRVVGYTVSQSLDVKVRNLDSVGAVLEKATSLGVNQASGLRFTVDDPTALQDKARLDAIMDARKKAGALADALNLHILKVVTFSESGGVQPPYPMPYATDAVALKAVEAPTIEPGTQDIEMTVSVTFEVR